MRKHIFVLFLLLLLLPVVSFAWTLTSHWNKEEEGGWSCIDRTGGGVFTGSHHTIDSSSGTPDPSNALKISYPSGWPMTSEPTHCWNSFPSGETEIWVQYYVKYSSNFHWGGDAKQIFINLASGGNFFIAASGSKKMYFVTQTYASNRFFPFGDEAKYTLNANQWYKVTAHFKMNDPGVLNGIGQVWLNDVLILNSSNVGYTSTSGNKFTEMTITPVIGGGGTKPAEDYVWFDYPIVSTSKIGEGSVPPGPTDSKQTPKPPSNLLIQ